MRLKSIIRLAVIFFLAGLVYLNQSHTRFIYPLNYYRHHLASLSYGQRYYAILQMWYYFAQKNDWSSAYALEKYLDPNDLTYYKSTHHPNDIAQSLDRLAAKPQKTIEDNLEIARLYLIINKPDLAAEYIKSAYNQDPVRSDLEKYYLRLVSPSPSFLPAN